MLKKCGQQIWNCLFMFSPITLKQLNSTASIDTLNCLSGREVTPQTEEQGVQFPAMARIFSFCCCYVFFCPKKNIIYIKLLNSFCNWNSFHILNILQNVWSIICVSRYWPIIFNVYSMKCCTHIFIKWHYVLIKLYISFATFRSVQFCLNDLF